MRYLPYLRKYEVIAAAVQRKNFEVPDGAVQRNNVRGSCRSGTSKECVKFLPEWYKKRKCELLAKEVQGKKV